MSNDVTSYINCCVNVDNSKEFYLSMILKNARSQISRIHYSSQFLHCFVTSILRCYDSQTSVCERKNINIYDIEFVKKVWEICLFICYI